MTPPAATILIVDDELPSRKLLVTLLRADGYLTRTAANGKEALASVAEQAPDLILIDVLMPGMDGYQVAAALKAGPATSTIPIIMVTALTDRAARLAGLNAGAEELLTKPVDRTELWLRVRNMLRMKLYSDLLKNQGALLEQKVQERTVEVQHLTELRFSEAVKQAAVLNALPAHIALLDAQGVIVSVNDAWRKFAAGNALTGGGSGIGASYLDICDRVRGGDAADASKAAAGIRAVLTRDARSYSQEYACHAPTEYRWFQLMATPLAEDADSGAIVMHINVTARRNAEHDLQKSKRLLDNVIENIPTAVQVKSVQDGLRILLWNKAAETMYGVPRDAAIGRNVRDLWPAADADRMDAADQELLAAGGAQDFPDRVTKTRDRGDIRVHLRKVLLSDTGGNATHLLVVADDITSIKAGEERVSRVNRVNAMLSGINGAIVRIRDRQALFEQACRIALEIGGFSFAWIGVADATGTQLQLVASMGRDDGFLQTIRDRLALRDPAPEAQGLSTRALLEGRVVVVNDVMADPVISRRQAFAERGIKAVAIFPLLIAGQAIGTFALHSEQAGFFDDDETRLLREVAANIAFALEHIEKEEKVRRLTRVYAVLSGINTLIVRVRDGKELFNEACRIAVEDGGFQMAWIGLVDRHAMKVKIVSREGGDQAYADLLPLSLNEADGKQFGISAGAVLGKKPVLVQDLEQDARIILNKDAGVRGLHSLALLPLIVSDQVVGVFALYSDEVGFFDEGEMKLLIELSGDIAFAIDHIGKRDRLDYLAFYDPLTGLANRGLFLERVAQCIRGAASGGHKLAVFLADVERFKDINDSLGRRAGDALLTQVAEWLKLYTGDASLLARIDADHFAMVLPRIASGGNLEHLIEKATAAIMQHPFRLQDAIFRIAVKTGVAIHPDNGSDAEALLMNAEAALKKAKVSGERFLLHTQAMSDKVVGKLTLENQLRRAFDNKEFVLHYQPKVSLASGRITGAEALIRWNDPLTGLVPPGRFIPVLEEIGLIHDVGRWALRQSMADCLRWRDGGLPATRIAVNVSPRQLRSQGFVADIELLLGTDSRAAGGLELEITESLIMEDVVHSIASLKQIRAMEVTIAIDDFGTGFSSLSYLARLPVDTLKIDRSFINDMMAGSNGLALVSTIISLAHSLQLKVVAEGVETEEQARMLRLLSCDEMQGFLFSKALPADQFEAKFLALPQAL